MASVTEIIWMGLTGLSSRVGTFRYIAPEVYFLSYSHQADVYSYGILLWELLECERSIAMFSKPVYVDPRGGLTNNGPQEPAQAAAAYGADRWERPLQ